MSLLRSVVNSSNEERSNVLRDTDHRMLPQKRILEKEYSIVFPSKKSCRKENDLVVLSDDDQEITDFKLALKLQQDELENLLDKCSKSSVNSIVKNQNVECTDAEDKNSAATALLSLRNHASGKQLEQ